MKKAVKYLHNVELIIKKKYHEIKKSKRNYNFHLCSFTCITHGVYSNKNNFNLFTTMKKALSIKQPWASLIAHGIKDIENRTWKTNFRGRIYIHACTPRKFEVQLTDEQTIQAAPVLKQLFDNTLPFGAIIGEVDIVDCVINHESIWAEKSDMFLRTHSAGIVSRPPIYNWVLENAEMYENPILNVKGKLSFWDFKVL